MSTMEGKNLVIVESPGKINKLQEYLGDDYIVKASVGHIRDLDENGLSIDLENGFAPKYVIPANKKKVVEEIIEEEETKPTHPTVLVVTIIALLAVLFLCYQQYTIDTTYGRVTEPTFGWPADASADSGEAAADEEEAAEEEATEESSSDAEGGDEEEAEEEE